MSVRNTTGLDSASTVAPEPPPADSGTVPSYDLSSRDRSAIIVDEWGPYDWQRPKLWPVGRDTSGGVVRYLLVALGPKLHVPWRLRASQGVAELPTLRGSRAVGGIGDTLRVTPRDTSDWSVTLTSQGKRFGYEFFEPPIDWQVLFRDSAAVRLRKLDFMWYRPPAAYAFLPQSHWSLSATGTVDLPRGVYSLRTISDDAVRVWIDDVLAIDNWTPHESQVDYAPLSAGPHELRVEYRQVDGWVELRVDIVRGSARSPGSPGPH